ncbi:MAG: YkgJ family cysteine cluster protein [Desulfobacteraceae bacterium]|nr:YkgJ family cysteine cluster protein [Desulfobacteraceae bacterium]
MPSNPVTSEDLFECRQCGQCCHGYGGTYLSTADIENIAGYLGISGYELIEKYCTVSGGRYILRQKPDGYCVFWDELCTIHPVKPRMCRAWPFIEAVIFDPANWDAMAEACPGMHTGFDKQDIVRCVRDKLEEPDSSPSNPHPQKQTGGIS